MVLELEFRVFLFSRTDLKTIVILKVTKEIDLGEMLGQPAEHVKIKSIGD